MSDGKWHHVAISFGNGDYCFYFDAQQAGVSSSYSVRINLVQTEGTPWCYVGRFRPTPVLGTCQSLGARIDRLRVYNRILSNSPANNEIKKLYQQDMDSDGLWDITENNTRYSDYLNSVIIHPDPANPTAPPPTQTGYARSPFLHSSAALDFDQDELNDLAEQTASTNLTKPDTDDDNLTDGFEISNNFNPLNAYSLGATGPRDDLSDPDSDTLNTLTEYLNSSNPRSLNSDGDAKNDAAEIAQGSDPANAADSGAAPADPPESVPLHINGDYTAWEATLKGKGPNDTRTRRFRMSAHNVAADQTLPLLRGNAYELSLRYIRTKPGESVPWYCWEASIAGKNTPAFTIANHWVVDNSRALLAAHTHSHGTNLVADKKVNIIPVEVVDKDKNPISKLKVGKMFETGVLSGTGASAVLDIENDSDRFFVRVKGGAAMGGISVKVSTTDNPEAAYNDNATQIDLVADGADAISKSMLLVSDDVDDAHPVDSIADDVTGDRTHKIQLGGNFKIEEIKIGSGAWQALGTKVSAPFEKTVNVKLVNCQYGRIFRGPCWEPGEITFLKEVLKERYAQTGIKLTFSEVAGPWISLDGWLDPGEYPTEVVAGVLEIPQVTKDIIDDGPVISQNEVAMYLVWRLDRAGFGHFAGVAIPPKYLSAANISYGNKILIGSMGAENSGHFTGPHELLHVLTDAKHGDFQTEFDDSKMLWHTPGSPTDTIEATKRVSKNQGDKILLNTLAQ